MNKTDLITKQAHRLTFKYDAEVCKKVSPGSFLI